MAEQGYAVTSRAELLGQIEGAVAEELDKAATLSESKYSELLRMERRAYSADQDCGTSLDDAIREAGEEFDAQFLATHVNELARFRIENR
ncbi:MAG: hypothetical protein GXP34_01960 [Actinobacteria bacterium]|nr:hypothetical protein [Actinomycetota bacterium]